MPFVFHLLHGPLRYTKYLLNLITEWHSSADYFHFCVNIAKTMDMALHNNDAVQKYNVNERLFRLASHINIVHKNGGVCVYTSFSQRRWLGRGTNVHFPRCYINRFAERLSIGCLDVFRFIFGLFMADVT